LYVLFCAAYDLGPVEVPVARVTLGAISLSSSSNFRAYGIKPVTLPPGRARLAIKPPPTG
jgi:hypothetical protein